MTNKKIYISDLDGTLLDEKAQLSNFSHQTLKQLIETGLIFTAASARNIASMRHILQDIPIDLPIIGGNGAYISDFATGHHHIIHNIQPDLLFPIMDLIQRHQLTPFISTYNTKKSVDHLYYETIANKGMDWYFQDSLIKKDARFQKISDIQHSFEEQVMCFNLIGRQAPLSRLRKAIEAETFSAQLAINFYENGYDRGWYWLTLHDHRAHKGYAIKILLEQLGYQTQQLTVFGDQHNDLSMFKIAGQAIAVENAIPSLKKVAHQVIEHHMDDSVVQYLAKRMG